MDNIFEYAEIILYQDDIDEKIAATHQAWQAHQSGQLKFQDASIPAAIAETKFPRRPELLDPHKMPRRKFTSRQGLIAFFHAIAHIEFIAIHLAWDILYRFRGMPEKFYRDWLYVADEEAQHFTLIRKFLIQNSCEYGDLPAHKGLWQRAEDTADDLPGRLALVPRGMEARGLDVTPVMIAKCQKAGEPQAAEILTRILNDEVGHVALGSYWFKFVCAQQGCNAEATYQALLIHYLDGKPKGPFNRELRRRAGFTEAELKWLDG